MKRRGFTVTELLIVVSIIAILAALIAPAINGALMRAKDAHVHSEITGLSNAVDNFKAQYGVYPPSSITLYERGSDWNLAAAAPHRAKLRKLYGLEFNFAKDRDINGDGDSTDTITLTGQECLVFFLGGLPRSNTNSTLIGFSHSKSDPFSRGGSSRLKFFDFDMGRLVDLNSNGMPEYIDRYEVRTAPLLYFREEPPYNASDCPGTLTSIYYFDSPNTPFRGYQIISAGRDGLYGSGGQYTSADPMSILIGPRTVEIDNLANFKGGGPLGH